MANTHFQLRRTSVTGRTANSTTLPNAGELALNMTDGILFSTNGSTYFAIGANLVNQSITNNWSLGSILTVNTTATYVNSAIYLAGSNGTPGQVLTSNGTSNAYWSTPGGSGSVNVAAQYTWTNTQTFSNTITFSSSLLGATINATSYATGGGFGTATGGFTANVTTLGIGNSTINATANSSNFSVGANVDVLLTGFFVGNTTVNTNINSSSMSVNNATSSSIDNGTSYFLGNTSANVTINPGLTTPFVYSSNTQTNTNIIFQFANSTSPSTNATLTLSLLGNANNSGYGNTFINVASSGLASGLTLTAYDASYISMYYNAGNYCMLYDSKSGNPFVYYSYNGTGGIGVSLQWGSQKVVWANSSATYLNSNTATPLILQMAGTTYATSNTLGFFFGNSTIATAQQINIANSIGNSTLTPTTLNVGNLTVNTAISLGTITTNNMILRAGTTTVAPLQLTSGTNLTTAAAGAFEYDGVVHYFSPAASTRGVVLSGYVAVLGAAYTLTSQTAAQKLFNSSSTGAITLPVGAYEFECYFTLSSMSTTSGSFGFALGGTAVLGSQAWWATASKSAPATATAPQVTFNTAAQTTLATATTTATGSAMIKGIIRVTTAGTLIPQVSLGIAAAAIVGINSYFKISSIGSNTVITVGNWS